MNPILSSLNERTRKSIARKQATFADESSVLDESVGVDEPAKPVATLCESTNNDSEQSSALREALRPPSPKWGRKGFSRVALAHLAFGGIFFGFGCATIVLDDSGADGGGGLTSSPSGGRNADGSGGGSSAAGGSRPFGSGGTLSGGDAPGSDDPSSGGRPFGGGGGPQTMEPSSDACAVVDCTGSSFPPPHGDVCFEFETSRFGGFQISNAMGCQVVLDGQPGPTSQNPVSAGSHTLEVSSCSNNYVSWNCWY